MLLPSGEKKEGFFENGVFRREGSKEEIQAEMRKKTKRAAKDHGGKKKKKRKGSTSNSSSLSSSKLLSSGRRNAKPKAFKTEKRLNKNESAPMLHNVLEVSQHAHHIQQRPLQQRNFNSELRHKKNQQSDQGLPQIRGLFPEAKRGNKFAVIRQQVES